ncbi:arabinofuranosyltransferase [Risungbinella massiliensis]|uniref:arabinofuranosyltransferase n=1 Tax=Risungbinella massiliensis TaxID=1329796 RepID=UPI0005CBD330|nr:arabinofuranosyltransferase [Risungbinella massiliensis]
MKMMRQETTKIYLLYLVFSSIICFLLLMLELPSERFFLVLIPKTLLFVALFLVAFLYFVKHPHFRRNRDLYIVLTVGLFLSSVMAYLYQDTYFGFDARSIDSEFVYAIITKYANFWPLVDFTYQDLSAFYPPLFFYVAGKLAWLFGMEPYHILRFINVWTPIMVVPLIYFAWRHITNSRVGMLVAITSSLAFMSEMYFKPYEFLSLMFILPWWFSFVDRPKDQPLPQETSKYRRFVVLAGFLGALIFLTFYYWFFLLVIYTLIRLVLYLVETRSLVQVWNRFRHWFYVAGTVFLFALVYFVPLFISIAKYGIKTYQNRYFTFDMLKIFAPHLENLVEEPTQLFYLIGLIAVILLSKKYDFVQKLLFLVLGTYVWQFLGNITVALKKPILHFKMEWMIHLLLMVAFSYAIYYLINRIVEYKEQIYFGAIIFVILILGQYSLQVHDIAITKGFKKVSQDIRSLETVDHKGKVFLTSRRDMYMHYPVFYFVAPEPTFTHHASRRDDRIQLLRELTKQSDPKFMAWMLTYNKFDKVDYLWLENKYQIYLVQDHFLKLPNAVYEEFTFEPSMFQSRYFEQKTKGKMFYEVQPIDKTEFQSFTPAQKALAEKYGDPEVIENLSEKS